MEVKSKKAISIFRMFLEHIIGLAFAIIILIVASIIIVSGFIQSGVILPANYAEQKLIQSEDALRENFDLSLLPNNCSYLIVDSNSNIKDTNMSEKDIEKTRESIVSGKKPYYDFYKEIVQENGNIVFIKYDMKFLEKKKQTRKTGSSIREPSRISSIPVNP